MCRGTRLAKVAMELCTVVLIQLLVKCIFIVIYLRVAIKHCEGIFRNIITARRTLREITILRQCKYHHVAKILYIDLTLCI